MVASVNGSDLSQSVRMEESPDPPFQATYKNLLDNSLEFSPVDECELPVIDLNQLFLGDIKARQACKKQIARASREWGFFQVINHGISPDILERMLAEQVKLFKKPFKDKMNSTGLNFSPGSYRWGTPSATSLNQLSWSEAFHVSLSDVLGSDNLDSLRLVMEQFTVMVSALAYRIVDILAEEICQGSVTFFRETCTPSSCYLRLSRYPLCPENSTTLGIMAHTDSDFITVLHQDNVGGLQLVRDGKWFAVKPNPKALIINIGDLFQAWSNDVYKSVEHRVVANPVKERFSMAYFFCPSYETVIQTAVKERTLYTSFSFGEYRKQVQEDVKILGRKIGLPRMISSVALSLSNIQPAAAAAPLSDSKSCPPSPTTSEPLSPTDPQARRIKSSPRLSRWSRARAVRSGRKLSRPVQRPSDLKGAPPDSSLEVIVDGENSTGSVLRPLSPGSDSASDEEFVKEAAKSIYMVSDATGWTVENSVNAALGQFEHCLVDRNCAVNTHLFSGIDDVERLMEIIAQAAKEGAMLVYTLADPSMADSARQACERWGVTSLDVLGPITESIAAHLGVTPSGLSRWAPGRTHSLGEEYFNRIEAIEFTIKQDDGALPENLRNADIILTGVSRTGKTPLSIYLAQKGYKVANVPIVMNVDLPASLFEVDPEKVFALMINPVVLHTIRRARAKTMGLVEEPWNSYSGMDVVRQELDYASKIFQQNPIWPVIEVTGKAIEETAATILRLYHDRKNKCSMPRISRCY